jgi:hypothetical protein
MVARDEETYSARTLSRRPAVTAQEETRDLYRRRARRYDASVRLFEFNLDDIVRRRLS